MDHEAKQRLNAALDESRRIEKAIDLEDQRKDRAGSERFVARMTESDETAP